jgi:hypothetical protein
VTDYNTTEPESSVTDDCTDLSKRAVRALTEKMTVLPDTGRADDANDLYLVVSASGSEYLVDSRGGRCDCPDAHHNLESDERCKHERRVNYATGQTPIPTWADTAAVDPHLGLQTARSPVRAVTDGGITRKDTDQSVESSKVSRDDDRGLIEDKPEECDCGELSDFPCWSCVRQGRKELPE